MLSIVTTFHSYIHLPAHLTDKFNSTQLSFKSAQFLMLSPVKRRPQTINYVFYHLSSAYFNPLQAFAVYTAQ